MPDVPDQELAIFSAARRLPPSQRAAYLDEVCAGDAALHQRVEELLAASEEAGAFLANPAAVPPGPGGTIRLVLETAEKIGDRVGRYKLLQQIGEGGCGVVYMAEQEEPVRRRVALKVIKLGMDTKSVIARFEAERQALALMDHPNIAKVLDAGATDKGRPYFVMELVRGIKITDYCDQNNLSTQSRLDLFVQVCRAVQHAHQKGIIHRDIKPSNILVTHNDGVPVPKVIDFGIAKATQGKLTDHTLFTAFEQFIGTPAYMSPEQAEMSALDIDTRSDLYSLGVLLYELLTGKTPFDATELMQAGLDEMRRQIREKEPLRPSTRLSTMLAADLTAVAAHRHSAPPKLVHLVRGDLDWIVMKCLEKDRTRRYETASGLAADIQRHLSNEPVVARPPSNLYKFQKLVRRNKLAFAAASAVLAALIIGLAVSTWLYFRERAANRRATAAEKAARTAAANSEQVAQFLQNMIAGVGPEEALGRDSTMMREILDKTEQRAGLALSNQPEVEAKLLMVIAGVNDQLNDFAKAEAMSRKAISLWQASGGKEDATVADWLDHLGSVQMQRGDFPGAEATIRQALDMEKKVLGENHPQVSGTLVNLAIVRREQGDLPGADTVLHQVLERIKKQPAPEQAAEDSVLNTLCLIHWAEGDLAGAETSIRRALTLHRKEFGEENIEVATALGHLGLILWERGDFTEAEAAQRQALVIEKKMYGTQNNIQVAQTLHNLASVLEDNGDLSEAESDARQSLAIETNLVAANHPNAIKARQSLAEILRRRGAKEGDPASLREALQLYPTDSLAADALACLLASASLTPIGAEPQSVSAPWRFTTDKPSSNWTAFEFSDADWQRVPVVYGATNYAPRSNRTITPGTNFWLRRTFELPNVPAGKLVFRLSRNHDAEIFINGIQAAAAADWTDADVLAPCSEAGRAALKPGANILAVHCQYADGGAPVEVGIYLTQDPSLGRTKLLEEFTRWIASEPQRADLYTGQASVLARQGRWAEAESDLAQATKLNASEIVNWYESAPLLLETGDLPGYDFHRQTALQRFAKPSAPASAAQTAILALLRPAQGAELQTTGELAHFAASAYADGTLPWRQFAQGLAEYRQGQYADAIKSMVAVQLTGARQNLPSWSHERQRNLGASALLIKAMACFQSGQSEPARAALKEGAALVEAQLPALESGDVGRDWPNWLIAHIFLREAEALIQ
jgi:serine/threonine protein kinase/tetratricopeptide (TPR) repeat protein